VQLQAGADVDYTHKDGWTALHYAVAGGSVDCVQELIEAGSDVNSTVSSPEKFRGNNTLMLAIEDGDLEITRIIALASTPP
jgi:ankyrin repeat protein